MSIDIRSNLQKFRPHLFKAQEETLNEADTCQRIVKFFEEVLGYDVLEDISKEKQIKDKYVDFAIKIDGNIKLLIEAKAAGISLRDRHIEQAERYAAEGNIPWVLLTNGLQWILYHLSFDEGIEYERVFSVDLSSDESISNAADLLGLLHKKSIKRGEHEEFWEKRAALCPASIGKVLMNSTILSILRREIRKQEGVLIDIEELAKSIHEMFTQEVREQIGPVRIRRKRKVAKANTVDISKDIGDTPPLPQSNNTEESQ